jgi:hypothetical protein
LANNSEVLMVRFDPNNIGSKQVQYLLPDLTKTTNYPASVTATQTPTQTGGYPVSSPVYATQ